MGFGTPSSQIQNQLSISLLASGSKADNETVHGQAGQTRRRRRGSGERPSRAGNGSACFPRAVEASQLRGVG